jgi:hypothetical protein
MDRIKLVLLASGIALSVAACADMMGGEDMDTMEPAAGPTMSEDPAMTDPTMPDPSVGGVEGPTAGGESQDEPDSPVN